MMDAIWIVMMIVGYLAVSVGVFHLVYPHGVRHSMEHNLRAWPRLYEGSYGEGRLHREARNAGLGWASLAATLWPLAVPAVTVYKMTAGSVPDVADLDPRLLAEKEKRLEIERAEANAERDRYIAKLEADLAKPIVPLDLDS